MSTTKSDQEQERDASWRKDLLQADLAIYNNKIRNKLTAEEDGIFRACFAEFQTMIDEYAEASNANSTPPTSPGPYRKPKSGTSRRKRKKRCEQPGMLRAQFLCPL